MKARFLAILAVCSASCSKEPTKASPRPPERRPSLTFAVTAAEQPAAARALELLQSTCGGLRGLLTEIAEVRISTETMNSNQRGWSRAVRVDMRLRLTEELSGQYQGRADIGGATLTFRLGGGREPGIATEQEFAQVLCGGSFGSFRPEPEFAFLETPPLPTQRVDFAKLFTLKRAGAVALLGKPTMDPDYAGTSAEDDESEDKYLGEVFHIDLVEISLEYRDELVSRAFVSSKVYPTAALLEWLGETDPAVLQLDAANDANAVWINSTRLPRKRVDAKRVLGGTRAEVNRYLGSTDFGDETWRRDGYMIQVMFDDADIVRHFDVTFDPGIRPSERPDEIRRWMNLPPGDQVTVRGRKYVPRADVLSMTWERRYL
jgi:hypothetical protein